MNKIKRTLIIAICVALASQFHLTLFIQGFIITLSVILLPVLLYNYMDLNPVKTTFVTGIVSPLFRGIIEYTSIKDANIAFSIIKPEIAFYFTYGILYYLFYYKNDKRKLTRFVFTVFGCDFLSNMVEMSIRTKIIGINISIIKWLLIIAAIRSLAVLGIVISMKYYRFFLIKEEHEARYRRLMLLTSSFKSEIYFMNKNISEIEDVMKKSYTAYKIIAENNYPDDLKELALDIAKDVHEIKKDYIRVIKGLEEMSRDKVDIEQMNIKDIISILETDIKDYVRTNKLNIELDFDIKADFYVKQHFYLMSILRNLINNSIEAMEGRDKGLLRLFIYEKQNDYVFVVSDNGAGIKESNLDFIYNPGFSTKFDKTTGNIGRGIGLTLVRDLIQNFFKGNITVESKENIGTTFTIKIPKHIFVEE